MLMSTIILVQLLGIPGLAIHRKKQYLWGLDKTSTHLSHSYGVTSKRRLEDYFDSKVLSDTKIRILEKELKD